MRLTQRQIMALAGLGSGLLLAAAFVTQGIGYPPCELCILQRWPHVLAIAIAVLAWLTGGPRALAWAGALVMLGCAALAFYHAGVEMRWWAGPTHCSGGASQIAGMSIKDLMQQIEQAPVVRCDEAPFTVLGLSMAGWHVPACLVLALVWLTAARRPR